MRAEELAALERRLSPERLGPYRAACGGSLGEAVALYDWNGEICAALGTTFGRVEVLLRNAMHDELTTWSTRQHQEPRWYLDPGGIFSTETTNDIVKARRRATRDGRQETPGRVVAELTLGFWRFLLARKYDRTLWHPCLHRAFPAIRLPRARVFDAVIDIHEARNRMAHHEPMFDRRLADLRGTALVIAGWICPVSRTWTEAQCRVSAVLAVRP